MLGKELVLLVEDCVVALEKTVGVGVGAGVGAGVGVDGEVANPNPVVVVEEAAGLEVENENPVVTVEEAAAGLLAVPRLLPKEAKLLARASSELFRVELEGYESTLATFGVSVFELGGWVANPDIGAGACVGVVVVTFSKDDTEDFEKLNAVALSEDSEGFDQEKDCPVALLLLPKSVDAVDGGFILEMDGNEKLELDEEDD